MFLSLSLPGLLLEGQYSIFHGFVGMAFWGGSFNSQSNFLSVLVGFFGGCHFLADSLQIPN